MLDEAKPQLVHPVCNEDHVKGAKDAVVTIVEYGDYECPSCANAIPVLDRLIEDFHDQLCVAFRHFPMNSVHAHAGVAAEAAECAAAQGKFWEMHHLLYKHQQELCDIDMASLAVRAELDLYKFNHDLANHTYEARIAEMRTLGEKSGVTGTPVLFLNSIRYVGSIHPLSIRQDIESLLETSS
ncbi:MAG: thioredoxin domain-containing protein [Planctomycetota bacterium]